MNILHRNLESIERPSLRTIKKPLILDVDNKEVKVDADAPLWLGLGNKGKGVIEVGLQFKSGRYKDSVMKCRTLNH
jgi:hypothetical protein